jgi:hypothetical protein
VQIDATDETKSLLYLLSYESAVALNLNIQKHSWQRHENVVLYLAGVCADYVPTVIDEFNDTAFEG